MKGAVGAINMEYTFLRGVKGFSPMMDFQTYFNMVWSFPLEYMHGVQ